MVVSKREQELARMRAERAAARHVVLEKQLRRRRRVLLVLCAAGTLFLITMTVLYETGVIHAHRIGQCYY